MQLEMEELETNPEGEEKELALIYFSKGIPEDQAKQMAHEIMSDKDRAHEVLIREELGINKEDLQGSAMEAAVSSFILFAIGAIIPVVPFFFIGGTKAIIISTIMSALGLFLIGASITLFTGKTGVDSLAACGDEFVIELQSGGSWKDPGYIGFDNIDGFVEVVVSGELPNLEMPGTYTIIYTATDKAGNKIECTRLVKVLYWRDLVAFFGRVIIFSTIWVTPPSTILTAILPTL
jgi:hypothetical protein